MSRKTLASWDTYVEEATAEDDRSLEFPLSADESYIIEYPTRARGKAIAKAQQDGDTDGLVLALLGAEAGQRVLDLSEDKPSFVLDELLLDVLRKFGMIAGQIVADGDDEDDDDASTPKKPATNGHVNGAGVTPGKPRAATKVVKPKATRSTTAARKSNAARRRSPAA